MEAPSLPPLVQARKLRASPSIQVVEHSTEATLDFNQECFKALCALRAQYAADSGCDPQDIFVDETLETLSCILPCDGPAFKEVLAMGQEATDREIHEKFVAFGGPCLDITSRYAMRMRAKSDHATFSPVEMHQRFDYRGASSSSKSLGGR
ncbi:hypothetical protein BJV74DRAFT_522612 [Russula compacta]|nr:hypothetical protein BJV74DRAFT_522612 [Russula compacta]